MTTAPEAPPIKVYDDDEDEASTRRIPFTAVFRRGPRRVKEQHTFQAEPRVDYKGVLKIANTNTNLDMAQATDNLLRKAFVDDDGVSADHVPAEDEDHPAFDAGSSLRRWVALMDHDDNVTISTTVIEALFKDLFQEASKQRPTKR